MSKHTPVPWITEVTDDNDGVLSFSIASPSLGSRNPFGGDEYKRFLTGTLYNNFNFLPESERVDRRAADLSLIAAAPYLLEACKAIVAIWPEGLGVADAFLALARAAIAKAEA